MDQVDRIGFRDAVGDEIETTRNAAAQAQANECPRGNAKQVIMQNGAVKTAIARFGS
jgi:hypothetical protein